MKNKINRREFLIASSTSLLAKQLLLGNSRSDTVLASELDEFISKQNLSTFVALSPPKDPVVRIYPMPNPIGEFPFRLNLNQVIKDKNTIDAIQNSGQIVFHMSGDQGWNSHVCDDVRPGCGGKECVNDKTDPFPAPDGGDPGKETVEDSSKQKAVIDGMKSDFSSTSMKNPSFLYLLGDNVYNCDLNNKYQYLKQLYEPYADYKANIFAIPGNHDAFYHEKIPDCTCRALNEETSLLSFMRFFCNAEPSHDYLPQVERKPQIQPNCFWTLDCPFVRIIGLFVNTSRGGDIDRAQYYWLIHELEFAPKDKALILASHNPIFGTIDGLQGCWELKQKVESAIKIAKRSPDLYMAGHMHNYQHLVKTDGALQGHYVVLGTGGNPNLTPVRTENGKTEIPKGAIDEINGVEMVFNQHTSHGYVRITVTKEKLIQEFFTVPKTKEATHKFEINLQKSKN